MLVSKQVHRYLEHVRKPSSTPVERFLLRKNSPPAGGSNSFRPKNLFAGGASRHIPPSRCSGKIRLQLVVIFLCLSSIALSAYLIIDTRLAHAVYATRPFGTPAALDTTLSEAAPIASTTETVTIPPIKMEAQQPATTSTAPPSPPPAHPPTLSNNPPFGISVADTLTGLSMAALNKQLDDIASLGVGWIRIDMDWSVVQRHDNHTYDWAGTDRVVAAASAHHLKVLAILVYTPKWARALGCQSNRCPPADPTQFGNFASAAAERYSSQGLGDWEIWNEPNTRGSWMPAADPAGYSALLRAGYTAIKQANPSAVVMTGGLAPFDTSDGNIAPVDFFAQLYEHDAQQYFDAVAFHPYSFPVLPSYAQKWNAWQQMADTQPSIRSIMLAHGDGEKKIWATEYGAPTGGPGSAADTGTLDLTHHYDHVTEGLQAQMASEAVQEMSKDSWAGPLFWYSYKDLGTSSSTIENFFGLLRADGSQKPSYEALRNAILAPLR